MALDLPITNPLTDAQQELTAKISSIQNLLALPILKTRNIKKPDHISVFDYLLKILEAQGLPVEPLFSQFLDTVFSEQNIFLEEAVLKGFAASLAAKGRALPSPNIIANPTPEETETMKNVNYSSLKSQFGGLFLANAKQSISKALMFSIFGGANSAAGASLVPDPAERQRLIDGATCGDEVFSVSVAPVSRNEDIEYNRIKLREELEKGEVVLEISCQKVKLTLPEDPGFFFTGGNNVQEEGEVGANAQAMNSLVNHMENQVQNINNEANAKSGGKSFFRILIEKLLSNITSLVQPHVTPVVNYIATQPGGAGLAMTDFIKDTCSTADECDSPTFEKDHAFTIELQNEMYRELTSTMLIFVIKKFKEFAINYLKRLAIERALRKAAKLKARFAIIAQISDATSAIDKYIGAIQSLSSIVPDITLIKFEDE